MIFNAVIFSWLSLQVYAQPTLSTKLYHSLDLIYQGDYERSSEIYNSLPQSQDQLKVMLEIFALRWEFVPIQLSEKNNLYFKKLTELNNRMKSRLSMEDDKNMFLYISTELLLAEYHFVRRNSWQALWHGKKVYPVILKSFEENRNDAEYCFVQGLYLYYIDHYSKKGLFYRSALSLFKRGDKEYGLRLLKIASEKTSIAQTEALIYLSHIYLRFENKPQEALPYAKKLYEKYPANLKFRELYIENLFASGQHPEGYALLNKQVKVEKLYYKIPALFLLGSFYLNYKGDTIIAKATFNQCLQLLKKNPDIQMEKGKVDTMIRITKS